MDILQPKDWPRPKGYSNGVVARGRLIVLAGQVGWDDHPIFQYEVNFQDTHLEHAAPGIADQIGFNQQPGEVYWLAINAEVGHTIVKVTNPDGTTTWVEQATGKFAQPGLDPLNPDGHF